MNLDELVRSQSIINCKTREECAQSLWEKTNLLKCSFYQRMGVIFDNYYD